MNGYHTPLVGTGIRRGFWGKWNDYWLDCQYHCRESLRKNTHAHYFKSMESPRPACDAGDLRNRKCAVHPHVQRVLMTTFLQLAFLLSIILLSAKLAGYLS